METIANNNQCTRFEDDENNQDVNDRSQYIADYEDIVHDNPPNEQENIVQNNAGEVYLIIYHFFCIHTNN
jgi:hypothetical protein